MKKKNLMPLLGAVMLGLTAYVGYRTYGVYACVNENNLLLENAEALAQSESSDIKKYITHHSVCKVNGIETGKYYAWCYKADSGQSQCHSHSCSDCSSY